MVLNSPYISLTVRKDDSAGTDWLDSIDVTNF